MVKTYETVKEFTQEAQVYPYALTSLKNCLSLLPNASTSFTEQPALSSSKRADILAEITSEGHQHTLLVEVKKNGEPQMARQAFQQLDHYRRSLPDALRVFIAPYISPETAKLCQVENVGYLDLAGNCHLAFPGVYIHVEGKPNPFVRRRSLQSLYQPKSERILRVLLSQKVQPWRIQALSKEADVSIGQAHKVKEFLLEKEWLAETEQGVVLTKPAELLTAWAEQYRFGKNQAAQFYTLSSIADFEQTLSFGCRQRSILCAFTSFAAASRYAPYATYQRTTAYLHHDLPGVQELLRLPPLQLTPVETGANVVILVPYDDGVFYGMRQEQDISLASPVQTYLDLQHTGGRGKEAAQLLLEKEIEPQW